MYLTTSTTSSSFGYHHYMDETALTGSDMDYVYFRLKTPVLPYDNDNDDDNQNLNNMVKIPNTCLHPCCNVLTRAKYTNTVNDPKLLDSNCKKLHTLIKGDKYNPMHISQEYTKPVLDIIYCYPISSSSNDVWTSVKTCIQRNNGSWGWHTAKYWKLHKQSKIIRWKNQYDIFCHQFFPRQDFEVVRLSSTIYLFYAVLKLLVMLGRVRRRINERKSFAMCLRATHLHHITSLFGRFAGTIHYPIKKRIFYDYGISPDMGDPCKLLNY